MPPTRAEIDKEIALLESYLPRVLKFSGFGESHPDAIEAQIEVLKRRLVEDDIEEEYEDAADNVRENAEYAARWLEDDVEDGTPSSNWVSLLDKEPVEILPLPDQMVPGVVADPFPLSRGDRYSDDPPGFSEKRGSGTEPEPEEEDETPVASPTATKTRKIHARVPKNNKKKGRKKASR